MAQHHFRVEKGIAKLIAQEVKTTKRSQTAEVNFILADYFTRKAEAKPEEKKL